jgi:signal transduction histidine kinase
MALLLRNLQQEVHSKAALDTIASIRRSLGSSMELLDDLLEFSRLDAGALRPEMGPIKIQSLFRGVLDSFSAEGQERGLRLVVRDTPLVGRSDPRLLTRILRNLVSNSFKFTQRGTILVAARPRGDRIRIEIWDTGRGIPEGMQRQIFWEFTQAGPGSSDRTVNGLGLGLAIVERLARLMRHEIGVRSVVDRGSVFWIDLPRLPSTLPRITTNRPNRPTIRWDAGWPSRKTIRKSQRPICACCGPGAARCWSRARARSCCHGSPTSHPTC